MALPDLVLELAPAEDDKQRISDPDGSYVIDLPPVENLSVSAKTSSTMRIQWTYPSGTPITGFNIEQSIGQPASWNKVATVSPTTFNWSAVGLPSDTYIGHRVNACNN